MPTCPNGHASDDPQFCSVCGVELATDEPAPAQADHQITEPCPVCSTGRQPAAIRGDFCEMCGYNFRTGIGGIPIAAPSPDEAAAEPDPAPVRTTKSGCWELHAEVDAALRGSPDPEAPQDAPVRIFPLDGSEALIGRRSTRRGILPEVSLDGDDGISHRHAKLLRQQDGSFAVLDLASSNGVRLNGTELVPNVLSAPLADGDHLELGRWTRLRVRLRA